MCRSCLSHVGAALCLAAFFSATGVAQWTSGSDGSDGAFEPNATIQIDLGLAATVPPGETWAWPSPVPGQGVYDPVQWAVVFKYTTINIPANVTVTFKNHPSGAPVVWLAQGDVSIAGTVNLNGKDCPGTTFPIFAEGGPGGFDGGVGGMGPLNTAGGGLGPGGGDPSSGSSNGQGGHYGSGSHAYGNAFITPLIGGSGGGGEYQAAINGGAGGGAIVLASSTHIALAGSITARGGYYCAPWSGYVSGGGSGGAIRLVSPTVSAAGSLLAPSGGGSGSYSGTSGRIRIEGTDLNLTGTANPAPSVDFVTWPVFPGENGPVLRAVLVHGVDVPADPLARMLTPDVEISEAGEVLIHVEGFNISLPATVEARIVVPRGPVVRISQPLQDAGEGWVMADIPATFAPGPSEVQLRATWTPAGAAPGGEAP